MMPSVAELVSDAARTIAAVSESPRLDAELMLGHVLGRSRVQLITGAGDDIDPVRAEQFILLSERRAAGEPVAWLIGRKEFWSMDLEVDAGVLVPRADTETLVTAALDFLSDCDAARVPDVLELGTGTGAIALAIANERPDVTITATDRCEKALANAARNIQRLAPGRIQLLASDWFSALGTNPDTAFDLIISNPPYIADSDPALDGDGLRHEPRSALVSGQGGFADLLHLINESPGWLRPGGMLMLEHGFEQAGEVAQAMQRVGYVNIQHHRDLTGQMRVTCGRRA